MSDFPVLTAIIFTPLLGALVVALIPASHVQSIKAAGYAFSVATLGMAGYLVWNFTASSGKFQFVESHAWIPGLGTRYLVGVDGISLFMVLATAGLFPLGLLASERYITSRVKSYVAWFLLLEFTILGVFLALDLILFFVFFELLLVPMYFLIFGWGSENRRYAAMKFFIYTMAGSAFLLAATLALGFLHQDATGTLTFDFRELAGWSGLGRGTETLLFLGFGVAFAVKVPLFPFHTWLPDVHTEAPTAGSVVLAGVIIKMGAYGFIRFAFELFPRATVDLAPVLLVLAVIGILYGAVVAAMQRDLKRVIAYSSVAHMGFVILGLFSLTVIGIDGAVFTMTSHPLTTGALFLVVGMLYERRHTRMIDDFGGIWKSAPKLTALFLIAMFAGIGLPGFSGFVGEFLALLGAFLSDQPYAIVAALGVILAAVYMLWSFQRTFTGKAVGENATLRDASVREIAVVAPLLALALFLGVYPKPVIDRIQPAAQRVLNVVEARTGYRSPEEDRERERRIERVEKANRELEAGNHDSKQEGE